MGYTVELYEKTDDKIPVLEFILSLSPKQQAKIYRELDTALERMKEFLWRGKNELE